MTRAMTQNRPNNAYRATLTGIFFTLIFLLAALPAQAAVVWSADFNANEDSFTFAEDEFRGTSTSCAAGVRVGTSPINGDGALQVTVGGTLCGNPTTNMSGGWSRDFTLAAESTVTVDFDARLLVPDNYEPNEYGELLFELDGTLFGVAPNDYLIRIDGADNPFDITASYSIDLGTLAAGTYTVGIGGFNNEKTADSELITAQFDDVVVDAVPTAPPTTANIGGTVFYDLDGSQVQNGIEVGLADARVNLHSGMNCQTPVIQTQLTGINGTWSFVDLAPGSYCVSVWEGSLTDGFIDTTMNNPTVLTVAAGDSPTVNFGFEATTCLPDIDWEADAAGNPLSSGNIIDDEYAPWGVTISAVGDGNGTVNDIAMIFDSANPTGGDADVGTPNEDFGGPGVGAEGGTGFLGTTANSHPQGNVLIISEDGDQGDPDDNGAGGTITFILDRPIEFAEATLVDVEDDCGGGDLSELIAYSDVGATNQVGVAPYPDLEDNGVDSSTLPMPGQVRRVDGRFCASGAIVRMRFCISPTDRTNAIGDRIWYDVDQDGVQDIGEPGLANVEVTLYDVGGDGMAGTADDVAVATTFTTDTDGRYLFPGLKDGTYYVDVTDSTIPTGLSVTAGSTDPTTTATVMGGQTFLDLDVGYTGDPLTAVIGDEVWSDADNDGLRDPGEPGIPGVTLDLVAPGPDGILGTGDDVIADTTTTGPDGTYFFIAIAPAEYRVDVTDTGGVLAGYTLTSGVQSNPDPTDPISLIAGEAHLTADFGYFNPSLFSISDSVWYDDDQDGIRDAGEEGFFGVTMSLLDSNGVLIASTITDANGDFSFNGVPNGDYRILKTDVTGVVQDFDETTTGAVNGFHDLTVAGADVTGDNFGYVRPGTVGDYVFIDVNGNGVPDLGETGIPGVTVTIHVDIDGNGVFDDTLDNQARISTTTDAAGYYLFEDLIPGTYYVTVDPTQPALSGYTATTTDQQLGANAPGVQRDAVLAGSSPANTAASSVLDADFGFQNPALANISGNVWNDLDADGFDDGAGEPRIPGVQLDLLNDSGVVISTTFTDANGDYSFNDLPPGDYRVAVNNTNGVLDGYRLTSGLDVIPVTLMNTDVTDVDFGYVRNALTGLIGDYVWHDADRDGNQDPAEPGFPQVTVNLFDVGPDLQVGGGDDVLVGTTQTDLNGNYVFMGLAEGKYYAEVDTSTLPNAGAGLTATTGTNNPTTVIDLSEGEQYRDADFGFAGTNGLSAIGDEVWYDANSNGLRDPGEPGIEGVTVRIFDNTMTLVGTTTTSPAGNYLFPNLVPGFYDVVVDTSTLPAGLNTTPTNNGGSDTFNVPLSSDRDELYADWGFDGGTPGAIGDTVFLDLDADGVQDPGEEGIEDVTLNLVGPGDDNIFGTTDDEILATDTTDADGMYLFSPLLAGDYRVIVTDINNVLAGLNLSPGSFDSNTTINLSAGQNFLTADFGYSPSRFIGAIGNQVWHDLNNDGVFDLGEPGLESVSLEIWVDNDNDGIIEPGTDNLLREVLTDFEGKYEFTGLLPENYLVTVTDRLNVLDGFTKTTGTAGLDNNSQSDPYAVTLTSGSPTNQTADFGYFAAGNLAITGTVFIDANADGVFDMGETIVPGASLRLFRDLNNNGVVDVGEPIIDAETSDSNGEYRFENLPAGAYVVTADVTSTIADGGEQTTQLATSGVQPVVLVASDSTDNDFGFIFRPTLALIKAFDASVINGQTVIEFTTHYESGSLSFDLYRVTDSGVQSRVNGQSLLASMGRDVAATYRVVDSQARGGEQYRYLIEETEQDGTLRFYGPYTVTVTTGSSGQLLPAAGGERIAQDADANELSRLSQMVDTRAADAPSAGPDAFFVDSFEEHVATNAGDGDSLKMYLREAGIYYVSAGQIAQALAIPLADAQSLISRNELRLTHRGQDQAWHAENDQGLFFYAQAIDSIFTEENVYWLQRGSGLRMSVVDASPSGADLSGGSLATHVLERDVFAATAISPDPLSDYWHSDVLVASNPAFASKSFSMAPAHPLASGNPQLTVSMRGASDGVLSDSHRVEVQVDGEVIGIANFSGFDLFSGTYALNPAALADGNLNITLTALLANGQSENAVYVDGFSLSYVKDFAAVDGVALATANAAGTLAVSGFSSEVVYGMHVNNLQAPVWLSNLSVDAGNGIARAKVTGNDQVAMAESLAIRAPDYIVGDRNSDLRSASNAANYLMVAPQALLAASDTLADLHRARGLQVQQVALEDVLDEFNHGIASPLALKDFFAYVHDHWAGVPDYLLLIGAGSFDYRDVTGNGGNLMPPLMIQTSRGLYASDLQFADVNGDQVPEFALGRLPVLNAAELATVTDKIANRLQNGASQSALLMADNPDNGGDFDAEIDVIDAQLGGVMATQILRASSLDTASMRAQISNALGAGVSLMDYVGHGGLYTLAAEGYVTINDAPGLPLSSEQPVFLALSCGIARFEFPGLGSLAEALLLAPQAGALAVWAPAGESFNFDAAVLNQAFADAVAAQPGIAVGDAIRQAYVAFAIDGKLDWLPGIYNLLGDPAVPVSQ